MTEEKQESGFTIKKKVDESWKNSVEENKHKEDSGKKQPPAVDGEGEVKSEEAQVLPEPDFSMFVYSLGMQVLMHLGELEHPVTQKKQKDLVQAKYTIDILGILQEKTKGNLSAQESSFLEGLLYDLRMKYVSASK